MAVRVARIWLCNNREFFMQNLLRKSLRKNSSATLGQYLRADSASVSLVAPLPGRWLSESRPDRDVEGAFLEVFSCSDCVATRIRHSQTHASDVASVSQFVDS